MEILYTIDGAGWSVSFQRRVGSANTGALPYVPIERQDGAMRVVLPLHDGEALWIAVISDAEIAVSGQAGSDVLRVVLVSRSEGHRALWALDAVVGDHAVPLDTASIARANLRGDIGADVLTVVLTDPIRRLVQRIGIIPIAPKLYEELSGLPAPAPSTDADAYRGWLLP